MSSISKNSGAVTWATLPHSIWIVPMSSVPSSSRAFCMDRTSPITRVPFWSTTRSTLGAARAGPAARVASRRGAATRTPRWYTGGPGRAHGSDRGAAARGSGPPDEPARTGG